MSGKGTSEYDNIPFGEGGEPDLNPETHDDLCHTIIVNGEEIIECRPVCEGGLCVKFLGDGEPNSDSLCTISFLGETCKSCEVCEQGDKVKISFDCSNQMCGGNVGLSCQGETLSTDCPRPSSESSGTTTAVESNSTSSLDMDAVTVGAFVGGAVFIVLILALVLAFAAARTRHHRESEDRESETVSNKVASDDSSVSSVSEEEENGDVENGHPVR